MQSDYLCFPKRNHMFAKMLIGMLTGVDCRLYRLHQRCGRRDVRGATVSVAVVVIAHRCRCRRRVIACHHLMLTDVD